MIGKTISHYRVLEKLGEGGMGVVYKAEDTKLKRTVALKFLTQQALGGEEQKARFIREAQAAAALDHPNICTVHEIDEAEGETPHERGRLFIAMAFVDGESLSDKIKSGALKPDDALEIARQVADGLNEAHEKGIVHRDIKSGNIMVTSKGQAKIMDFGLAKLAGQTRITKTGRTMGTVAYMSPEQARGEKIDHRSDLWSLGVVLYEMATGELPFKGEYEQAVAYSILNEDPKPITETSKDVSSDFEGMVNNCLQKTPDNRYQTISELKSDMDRLMLGTAPARAPQKPAAPRGLIRAKGYRLPALVTAAVILILFLWLIPSGRNSLKTWLRISGLPAEKYLAVLPFTNVGDDPEMQAFSDGLMETLTSKLTQLEQFQGSLWVVPASDVRQRSISSATQARQAFGVNLAVTGSVQRLGDDCHLTLNLVDAKSLRQLMSEVITEQMTNITALQEGVVIGLAKMLDVEVHPESRTVVAAGGTTMPDAYNFYLQARGFLSRYEKMENIDTAIDLFERAIERDSLYALAYAGLGEAYWRKFNESKDSRWVDFAVRNSEHAIMLNDRLSLVHITLGMIHTGTGAYEKAIQQFERALSLDPVSASAYRGLAGAYERLGKLQEAESTYQKATELKPDYWGGYNELGKFYWKYGRYEDAARQFRRVVALTPDNYRGYGNLGAAYLQLEMLEDAREMFENSVVIKENYGAISNLGIINYKKGRYADAARMYEKALELNDRDYRVWASLASAYYWSPGERHKAKETYWRVIDMAKERVKINPRDSDLLAHLAGFYADVGNDEQALRLIEQALALGPKNVNVMYWAGHTYEQIHEREKALKWIGKALENGYPRVEIERDPWLYQLRADRRFQLLVPGGENQSGTDSI